VALLGVLVALWSSFASVHHAIGVGLVEDEIDERGPAEEVFGTRKWRVTSGESGVAAMGIAVEILKAGGYARET
jgi:hypothetical protein